MTPHKRWSPISLQSPCGKRAHKRVGICTNLQTDGLRHYHYDSQGRLQSSQTGQGPDAPTTRYAHNALGQRVFKTEPLYAAASSKGAPTDSLLDDEEEDPGLLQILRDFFTRLWSPSKSDAEHLGWAYVYDEDGSLLGEYGMGGAQSAGQSQYIYLPTAQGPIPIAAEIDNRLYAIHTDHLGRPRRLTQADGQAAWQWAYTPYGDEAPTLRAKRFTNETTNPTTGATNIAPVRFNLRYPGQYFDAESGLHYNYFRSYDPRTGRYTQGDPIGLDGGWNRFAYVGGNPLSFTDPQGLCPWCAAGLAIGVWANIGSQLYANGGNWGGLDYKAVVFSGLAGAASGGQGTWATGFRTAGSIAANTIGSGAISGAQQAASNAWNGQCTADGVVDSALKGAAFGFVGASWGSLYNIRQAARGANNFLNTSNAVSGPFFPHWSTNWAIGGTVGGNVIGAGVGNANQ